MIEQQLRAATQSSNSGPSKPTQGEHKRNATPEHEHQQTAGLRSERCNLQDRGTQRVVKRSERQCSDQGMYDGGETLVREKDARKNPHRHHYEVNQPADTLNLLRATSRKQA